MNKKPLSLFLARPLAILPSALDALEDTIRAGPGGLTPAKASAPATVREGRVAVVRMHGPIWAGAPAWLGEFMGLTDPYVLAATLRALAADKDISGIVLDVNSPGGVIDGVDEAFEAVKAAAAVKPVIASVRDLMGSAAYWIASAASTIVAGKTSMVGSIGTFVRWTDYSRMAEEDGLQVYVYRSGDLKAPGQPGEAHNEHVDTTYTSIVEDSNAVFLAAVAQGRGVSVAQVRERWASGRVWVGEHAVAAGVADRLGNLADAVRLAGAAKTPSSRAASSGGKEGHVPPEILKRLGLSADATPEQMAAALDALETQASAAARAEALEALGLDEGGDLKALAAQAADGAAYRQSLVEQLQAHTVTLQGNDESGQQAAERAAKVWGQADISDLKAEVERLQGQIEAAVPAGRVSTDGKPEATRPRHSAQAYGLR